MRSAAPARPRERLAREEGMSGECSDPGSSAVPLAKAAGSGGKEGVPQMHRSRGSCAVPAASGAGPAAGQFGAGSAARLQQVRVVAVPRSSLGPGCSSGGKGLCLWFLAVRHVPLRCGLGPPWQCSWTGPWLQGGRDRCRDSGQKRAFFGLSPELSRCHFSLPSPSSAGSAGQPVPTARGSREGRVAPAWEGDGHLLWVTWGSAGHPDC